MVLQNLIPIRYFLHNKWPPKGQKVWRKKKKQKKKKKSRQTHRGSRQRTGCPNKRATITGGRLLGSWPGPGEDLATVVLSTPTIGVPSKT